MASNGEMKLPPLIVAAATIVGNLDVFVASHIDMLEFLLERPGAFDAFVKFCEERLCDEHRNARKFNSRWLRERLEEQLGPCREYDRLLSEGHTHD